MNAHYNDHVESDQGHSEPLLVTVQQVDEEKASRYSYVYESLAGTGRYLAYSKEMPGVFATGSSPDESIREARARHAMALAGYRILGRTAPRPLSAERKTEYLSCRCTSSIKQELERRATAAGTSLSDEVSRVLELSVRRSKGGHENGR